ncbi:DMT family transporter [Pseudoalteromonas sp. OOF1S-7]|uniref:DMT family transporter n=1 Tax=Pseudoalteromonas sp. OOF1S-7 TaxID=2917757 RepID=UPI001EF4E8A7|nr:DMT family transporter [Pseudoalteromonas sp. OOF1S-7]MCG7534011.1 DMT family transporter [Pseudoalteromonas sp. OOF1S-7]
MLSAFFSALCWACFDFLRKQLAREFSAPLMSVMFSLLVLPGYLVYWVLQQAPVPDIAYFVPGTISGLLAAIGSVCFIRGLAIGKIAVMLPLLSVTPVVSGAFAWLWLDEPLGDIQMLALGAITLGSFILQGGRFSIREKGAGYVLITALCWGMCIVFDKQALQHSEVSFHLVYLTASVVVINSLVFRPELSFKLLLHSKWLWACAALVFAFAVVGQLFALQQLQPGVMEAVKRAIGISSAALLGVYFYKEALKGYQWFSIAVILAGTLALC